MVRIRQLRFIVGQKMSEVRFRHLTETQKQFICNGCKGKGSWFDPPDFIFTDSCNHHDFNYWLGGSEGDRMKADWQFYQSMLEAANKSSWYKRYWYKTLAWVYYQSVRLFATNYFHFAKSQRTREDLLEVIGE